MEDVFSVSEPRNADHFILRAIRWLEYGESDPRFEVLLHACIDIRYGIEELLFELFFVGQGGTLTVDEYKTCLKSGSKLHKTINRFVPEFQKLQEFTVIVVGMMPPPQPKIVSWNLKELVRDWGDVSNYLHWRGAPSRTTDDVAWVDEGLERVGKIVNKIAIRMRSGDLGSLNLKTMPPKVIEIWEAFREDKIDESKARELLIRLKEQ